MTDIEYTKSIIFDIFYSAHETSRSGGGKLKTKIGRNQVSFEKIIMIKNILKNSDDDTLLIYFQKLESRDPGIAPPPRPK